MTMADLIGAAVTEVRWEAATELVRAVDTLTTLEQCERATGRPWVRLADKERVMDARARWLVCRGGPSSELAGALRRRAAMRR